MHAFLLSTCNLPSSVYTLILKPDPSLGIEDIRQAQKFLSTLPPQNQINRLVVLEAEKMTLPAQNAFLKTLEEPPAQSEIYLVTTHPDQLLPTILSRVEIKTDSKSIPYTSSTLENSRILWQKLQKAGVGESLAVIDEMGFDRTSFLHFLDDLEFILHESLSNQVTNLYSLLVQTRHYTQSNCNLRLVTDNFIIQLTSAIYA